MPPFTTAADLAALAELVRETYEDVFMDALDHTVFMSERVSRRTADGTHTEFKVHFGKNESVQSYLENDDLPDAGNQSVVEARLPMKQVLAMVQVSGLIQAATQGKAGFQKALSFETDGAIKDLKDGISRMMLAPGAPAVASDITGIGGIISDVGVYAEIDRATHEFWQSYVLDGGGVPRALTIALMQDVMGEMSEPHRKAEIDEIWTARQHWYDYGNLLEDRRRYTNSYKLDAGWDAIDFEGVPILAVPAMPTGDMYFVDKRYFSFDVLENLAVEPKDVNKDATRLFIKVYGELLCRQTGRQARITEIS